MPQAAVSVLIGAELGASFKGAFASANSQLSSLGSTIKKLSDTSANIASFRTMQSDTLKARQAWNQAEAEVKRLSKAIAAADKPSKELRAEFRAAVRDAGHAKAAYKASSTSLHEMGKSLRAAGIDTKNLAAEQKKLGSVLETLQKRQGEVSRIETAQAANKAKRSDYRAQMVDAVALGATLYKTIKPAVEFEYAMARVGAITNEAAGSEGFKALTAQARELGRTTQYTASQAADAMQYLGMAGFNTQQILAATPAALNLAIAGNLDLARTADIASNILTGFNMKAEETTRVADVLAQVSRTTNVDVSMLGDTMKYVAPAAAAVGGTLEDTAALAGVLGDAGIQGTMAGTMLRSAYLRLSAPSKAGTAALESLREQFGLTADEMPDVAKEAALAQSQLSDMGVSIFDDAGKMRPMVDIMRDLSKAMRGLTDEDKLFKLKAIFGERSSVGALAIFKNFETGRIDEVLQKVWNSKGAAEEMANRMKATTRGAFLEFSSAIESVGISLGAVLLPTLSSVARGAAAVASKVSELSERFPVLSKYIGLAVAGLIGAKVAGIALGYGFTFLKGGVLATMGVVAKFRAGIALLNARLLITKGITMGGMFAKFGASILSVVGTAIPALIAGIKAVGLAIISNPIGLAIAAAVAAIALLIANWDKVKDAVGKAWSAVKDGASAAMDWVKKKWEPIGDFFSNLWNAIADLAAKAWNKVTDFVMTPINKVKSAVGKAWNWLTGNDEEETAPANRIAAAALDITPLNAKAGQTLSSNRTTSVSTTANISVHPTPGMDERKIATEIQRILAEADRNAQMRARSANYD